MKKSKSQQGFTLIEMVVAIALFIVVALVAVVALLQVVNANKKAQSLKTAVNNMNFALESMTREIRTGRTYYCVPEPWRPTELTSSHGCEHEGNWAIAFNTPRTAVRTSDGTTCNLITTYYYNGLSLYKGEQTACDATYSLYPLIYGTREKMDYRLNENQITFTKGSIKVVTGDPDQQPYVQLRFAGSAGTKEKLKSYFDIQTTVSQRIPD